MKLPLNSFTIAAAALLTFLSPWPHAVAQQGASQTAITDLASWKHPVKAVLQRNNVKLLKVEISINKKHPEQRYFVFYVSLPYDPQSSETTSYFTSYTLQFCKGWVSRTMLFRTKMIMCASKSPGIKPSGRSPSILFRFSKGLRN